MPAKSRNPTAGSAEPNWFEWQTGLLRLVEMLDEDSDVVAVAFQLHGTKGWDDVGVRFRNGSTRLFQMKHSRSGDTLTFGDLIARGEDHSPSLLRSLAAAWKEERLSRGAVECVLLTNRPAGPNWYEGRPPLDLFYAKVKERINDVATTNAVVWDGEDERFPAAWAQFLAELSDLENTEQLDFLRALTIGTSAPDLSALESQLHDRLEALTGLPRSSVHTLFNTLHAHLRTWTCHSRRLAEWIDRESLRAVLAGEEAAPLWLGHCEVETPDPFFPSRVPITDDLRTSLLSVSPHKLDFLSAEPGAGKTSCTSKLARSGAVRWQEQCVSIRFYAYRPIRPGQLDIGSDVSGVRPEALWLGLLWQIRNHLRSTHLLGELRVPVWLDGMPWDVARSHVLRLANELGQRWERPFIICIDGIDHAARARRKQLPEFLGTLPAPAAIPSHVRLFLAGQPAESYPEYPFFLRQPHPSVKVHQLGELRDDDLRLLWRAANPRIGVKAEDAVLRLLAEKTRRRTLPAVYAVEDIRESTTLDAAAAVLNARPLPDSLHEYYDAIWSAATVTAGDSHRVAVAFSLLRERPTGELMAAAFFAIGKSAPEWTDTLRALRPLVRDTAQGFELVHNDLRVHLEARLAGDPLSRRDAACAFAQYYRTPNSNRLAAHRSLLNLLTAAGRKLDFADDFDVDWVIEAGALSIADELIPGECDAAFRAAVARRDWGLLHGIACAALTYHRLHDCVNEWSRDEAPFTKREIPSFLPIEGEPRPLELWTRGDFSELVSAGMYLADRGALSRATVALRQWIGDIPLETLVCKIHDAGESDQEHGIPKDALRGLFERFGRLCAACGVSLGSDGTASEEISDYIAAAETGWAEGLAEQIDRRFALRLWCSEPPRYLTPWFAAVKAAAARSRWSEVRGLMRRIGRIDGLSLDDRILLGWYAARAKPANLELWLEPFNVRDYGLVRGQTRIATARIIAQCLTYSDPIREAAQVSDDLFPLIDLRGMDSKSPAAIRLLLRASAMIGRMLRYRDSCDFKAVESAVPPMALAPYLDALWCREPDWRNLPHEEVQTPGQIGRTLAEVAWDCGSTYHQILHHFAIRRFADVILDRDGPRVFDMLSEFRERAFLTETVVAKAQELIVRLHEDDAPSRTTPITNLLQFAERLGLSDLAAQLSGRLATTRIGYGCHKEWVFQPLVRWFELLRKHSPSLWRSEGMQLLALDRIAEQQHADNAYGDEVTAEVSAAAMTCGPSDFEALFGFLANRDANCQLWDLEKAAQEGFEICLREGHPMSDESAWSRAAIAIAVGRWPSESPLRTISALLTAHGVPPELAGQPEWQQAIRVAAEMQGLPATVIAEREQSDITEPKEERNADEILAAILQPDGSSWTRLRSFPILAEQANKERHPKRDELIATALSALEGADAFSRFVEFHEIGVMSVLYAHLTEAERWRLLGALVGVTGEIRRGLPDANSAFMIAFSAVNLMCRARAAEVGHEFALATFQQLIGMHWKWHGVSYSCDPPSIRQKEATWAEVARRTLLSLTRTDGCEPLYMAMSGMRFFADLFPEQIPALCREGLAQDRATDALLSLAQLWATRHPQMLAPALSEFEARQGVGSLDHQLDSWTVGALFCLATAKSPRKFQIPRKEAAPEILFPGDTQLFETEAEMNGLIRHNSFARMANTRLRRAGMILGPMEEAFRFLVRRMRESDEPTPSFYLGPAKRLAFDGNYPRPSTHMEHLVGDAILHQSAGDEWSPNRAAAIRLAIGYGMDPWIASTLPNLWPDKHAWPSGSTVESWIKAGAPKDAEEARKIYALLEGEDLAPDMILLGAVLHVPTYLRDLEFRFWLMAPGLANDSTKPVMSSTPSGRTLAGWLAGWSFASTQPSGAVSVQFVGDLVNYPNSQLNVTPTNQWTLEWRWRPDPENAFRFRADNGATAAWHERWLGSDSYSHRTARQPILCRWVARRDCLPPEFDGLRAWVPRSDVQSEPLSRPG